MSTCGVYGWRVGGGGGEWVVVVVVVGVTTGEQVWEDGHAWVSAIVRAHSVRGGDTTAAHPLPEALRTLDCGRSDTRYAPPPPPALVLEELGKRRLCGRPQCDQHSDKSTHQHSDENLENGF
jgi:hypothetical protein